VPRAQALANPTYESVVAAMLRAKNIKVARGRLTQHLRVDLNGDGTEEVLLVAHSRDSIGP
jgi:D-Tyr-tRNAtyr deacylase